MNVSEGFATGAAVGFTSFVSHAGGPVAAVFLLSRNLAKTTYQATTVLVFWAVNVAKFVIYGVLGIFTVETFAVDALLAPFALLGTWLGVKFHKAVPEKLFFNITYVLLTVTGSKLVWDGLS